MELDKGKLKAGLRVKQVKSITITKSENKSRKSGFKPRIGEILQLSR